MSSPDFKMMKVINAVGLAINSCDFSDFSKSVSVASGQDIEFVESVIERLLTCNIVSFNFAKGSYSMNDVTFFQEMRIGIWHFSVIASLLFNGNKNSNLSLEELSGMKDFLFAARLAEYPEGIPSFRASESLESQDLVNLMAKYYILQRSKEFPENFNFFHHYANEFLGTVIQAHNRLSFMSISLNLS